MYILYIHLAKLASKLMCAITFYNTVKAFESVESLYLKTHIDAQKKDMIRIIFIKCHFNVFMRGAKKHDFDK